jgi:hypothetical protein
LTFVHWHWLTDEGELDEKYSFRKATLPQDENLMLKKHKGKWMNAGNCVEEEPSEFGQQKGRTTNGKGNGPGNEQTQTKEATESQKPRKEHCQQHPELGKAESRATGLVPELWINMKGMDIGNHLMGCTTARALPFGWQMFIANCIGLAKTNCSK